MCFTGDINNKQEVFDHVLKALRTQEVAAYDGITCVYYDQNSDYRCAIGHLKPVDAPDPPTALSLETTEFMLEMWYPKAVSSEDLVFFEDLQEAHDKYMPQENTDSITNSTINWEKEMKTIAGVHKLVYMER